MIKTSGYSRVLKIVLLIMFCLIARQTNGEPLQLSTTSEVNDEGRVKITLAIQNVSGKPIFHVHPMFHFHHSHSMAAMIHKMEPGERITLENTDHPKVLRVGRYPLAIIANYSQSPDDPAHRTQLHTDSFYYREAVASMIEGEVSSYVKDGTSLLRVLVRNTSSSFKNIEMMLLFPPGLSAETFKGMKGFTIGGGEEKRFEIPVSKLGEVPDGEYPVHLMVEYGELMKHYTGEIRGKVVFPDMKGPLWPHLVAITIFVFLLIVFYRMRSGHTAKLGI